MKIEHVLFSKTAGNLSKIGVHTSNCCLKKWAKEYLDAKIGLCEPEGGGIHDIFGRGCATIKSLYRPFLEFLTKKLDPFRNFCA